MKTNTINKKEIEKFSRMAEEWWNPQGKFKPLHKFNPVRIKYIKENIIKSMNIRNKLQPLSKIKILDIGCLLYTSPSPRDPKTSRMPSSA